MFGKNRKKKVGLCVMVVTACLVLATLWAVLATPETALADHKPGHDKPGGGGGGGGGKGERTAQVTISGPMETDGAQTFPIKDSEQTLILNRGVWTESGAVPIRYNFTVEGCEGDEVLKGHLVNPENTFPLRWGAKIRIDMSNLKEVGDISPTNKKGGHSIDITTDPDPIEGVRVKLWIPEGPNKSGPVTVEWVSDTSDSETRTRVFRFTPPFKIQVVSGTVNSKERKIMRCDNLDDPITVTVVTTP